MNDASGQDDRQADGDDIESLLFASTGPPVIPEVAPAPHARGRAPRAVSAGGVIEFGEEAYCEAYPDIHAAISGGMLDSAATHYSRYGRQENRLTSATYLHALIGNVAEMQARDVPLSIDVVMISHSGTVLVVGWIDDRAKPVRSVSIIRGAEGANTRAVGRCRRPDVDALLNAAPGAGFGFGFWLVLKLETLAFSGPGTIIRARLSDGSFEQREVKAALVADADLRETILGHFAALQYYGNRDIEAFANLDLGLGQMLVRFNRAITGAITAAAHAEYYGPRRIRFKASLIICLFGKIEYFFLQNALFLSSVGIGDYEFIYVSNSPELTESLDKEARIAERIYGHSITLVTLPGNAGFSAANNAAARFARSERVIFINPDVFPRDPSWTQSHAALIADLPREHTALFGVPLYYDDGSLMHGGMYFEVDRGLSVKAGRITAHGAVRVEHYGKGAPLWSDKYTRSRPVSAVTGAFISADREWFHALGGFTEDYVFGHYEDADLCLKSLRQGVPVWLHDVRFWHLEGKGSVRRPAHEGGSLINRWLFTRRWGETIADSMVGPSPAHPLLALPRPAAAEPVRQAPPPAFRPSREPGSPGETARAKRGARNA